MAWTVELYNPSTHATFDITARTLSISASEQLDDESNTFDVDCRAIELQHKWHIITIYKNAVPRYKGIILNQSDSDLDGDKVTSFRCADYSHFFKFRIVAEQYDNKTIDFIFKDIISKHLPELTTTNVAASTLTIDSMQFQYLQTNEAVRQIFEHSYGWHWYVDAALDVHMFYNYEVDGPAITKDIILSNSFKCDYIADEKANRVWVIGLKQTSGTAIDQYFTGDGAQRYFSLAYSPNFTEIYVDDVLKDSKLEENDDGAQDFLINKENKVVIIPSNKVTPFTGSIRVNYKPTIQIIDYFEDYRSIDDYWLVEKTVRNKDITDKLSARQFGKAEIKRKALDKRNISFSTRTEFLVGQKCTLSLTHGDWDVVGSFLVVSVNASISPIDTIYNVGLEEL